MNRHPQPHRARAFTLVELTIVVLMISILAALVVPKISEGSDESRASAAATTANAVQTKVFEYNAINGSFPAAIDKDWFADKSLPSNPWDPGYSGAPILYDAAATAAQTHPAFKHFRSQGVFWYNARNGRFRALVPYQEDDASTLELYNKSNGVSLGAYDAVTGG